MCIFEGFLFPQNWKLGISVTANIEVRDQFQATAWDYASNKQLHYCQLIIKSHMHQSLQVGLRAANSNNLWQKNPDNRFKDQSLTVNQHMHCNTNTITTTTAITATTTSLITTTAFTTNTAAPIATATTITTTPNVGYVIKTNHQRMMRHDSRRSIECSSDEEGNNNNHVVFNTNNNNNSNLIRRGLRNRSASFQSRGESNGLSKVSSPPTTHISHLSLEETPDVSF